MRKTVLLLAPLLLLASCSWGIRLSEAGRHVRTAWNGDVSGCRELGKVTVSVMDHVGPVDRNNITVSDELEVMARNQAADMHADTIKPLSQPADGSQPWGAYACGPARPSPATVPVPARSGTAAAGTQTFPIHGG